MQHISFGKIVLIGEEQRLTKESHEGTQFCWDFLDIYISSREGKWRLDTLNCVFVSQVIVFLIT